MDQMTKGIKFLDVSKQAESVNNLLGRLNSNNPQTGIQCSRALLKLVGEFEVNVLSEARALDNHIEKYELDRGYVYFIGTKISSVSIIFIEFCID